MTVRAFDVAASRPWAILPDRLEELLAIAERTAGDPEALAAKLGRPLEKTYSVEVRDQVAILPIRGPIFRYANLFTMISGATSTELLATDFQAALDDRSVRAILLDIDSPGGDAAGIHELGELIYAARQKRPVWTYSGGLMASAAYWIGSAAERVFIDPTSILGSIGVVMTHRDTSERDAKSGVRTLEIVSSQSPDKRINPATDDGRAKVQRIVDDLAAIFVASVARNRNVDVQVVTSEFGRGGLMVGDAAIRAGMADGIWSFEKVLAELAGPASSFRSHIMITTAKGPVSVTSTAELRTALKDAPDDSQYQASAALLRAFSKEEQANGKAEGLADLDAKVKAAITGERERVTKIHSMAPAGFEKDRDKAIAEGMSAADFSMNVLATAKDRGITLGAIAADSARAPHAPAPSQQAGQKARVRPAAEIFRDRAKAAGQR